MKNIKIKIDKEKFKKKLGIQDGKDGTPGKDADEQKIINETLTQVLKVVPPLKIIDELKAEIELLKEIEVKYQELEKKILELPKGARVTRGFQLLTNGTKRGLTVNTMNLIGGAGITLTYNYSSGRNDITITGGGGASLISATGTVDGSNTIFVFASAPNLIVVDGVPKQKVQSDGTVNWTGTTTVTLTVAPNYDIYALG